MNEPMSRAVVEVFVRLYKQGLIYRGKRLVNWDPVLGTAVSDLEVDSEEEDGKIWEIRYPLEEGDASLVVATTRPETMLGDVAVAVNPNDERYAQLVGKRVTLPLTGRSIPIIALNMVGSITEHVDLVVSDPVQAGTMAVMAVAETATFDLARQRGRRY